MDNAFDRLTPIQRLGVNRKMFELAYVIVTTHKDEENIRKIVEKKVNELLANQTFPASKLRQNLMADLTRYCRLAKSVM